MNDADFADLDGFEYHPPSLPAGGLARVLGVWAWQEDVRRGRPTGDLVDRARAYIAKIPPAVSGQGGHDATFRVACILVKDFGLDEAQALDAIGAWNKTCLPPWSEKELRHKLRDAAKQPGPVGSLAGEAAAPEAAAEPAEPVNTRQPLIDRACDIKTRRVEWLWPGVIPLRKLTTFAGPGGLGKTFVLCDITAHITTGAEWPFTAGECAPQGQVLFISGEDDPDDTLVPRLSEMGADLNQVTFLKTAILNRFTLADLSVLRAALDQTGSNVRLVVIDPPTAYLGTVDDHKNAELRGLLSPLAALASRLNLAVVFNTHVNKQAGRVDAMMRVMGSVAWVNAVRAAHLFVRDPDDFTKRLFLPMKNNLGPERKGLSYTIAPTRDLAEVKWLGEVDVSADEAVAQGGHAANGKGGPTPKQADAEAFLRQLFKDHTDIPSKEVFDAAKLEKIGDTFVKAAKTALGIVASRRNVPGVGFLWFWVWPANHVGRQNAPP